MGCGVGGGVALGDPKWATFWCRPTRKRPSATGRGLQCAVATAGGAGDGGAGDSPPVAASVRVESAAGCWVLEAPYRSAFCALSGVRELA